MGYLPDLGARLEVAGIACFKGGEPLLLTTCLMLLMWGPVADATQQTTVIEMELQLPELDVRPYHRPYVAVWLETLDRKGVHTILVWHEQDDWLKDMRQWWRKLGRSGAPPYDGVSGATRKPGMYRLSWDGLDASGNAVAAGRYFLNVEAAREDGGREFLRQEIELGAGGQTFTLQGEHELGTVKIRVLEE